MEAYCRHNVVINEYVVCTFASPSSCGRPLSIEGFLTRTVSVFVSKLSSANSAVHSAFVGNGILIICPWYLRVERILPYNSIFSSVWYLALFSHDRRLCVRRLSTTNIWINGMTCRSPSIWTCSNVFMSLADGSPKQNDVSTQAWLQVKYM